MISLFGGEATVSVQWPGRGESNSVFCHPFSRVAGHIWYPGTAEGDSEGKLARVLVRGRTAHEFFRLA